MTACFIIIMAHECGVSILWKVIFMYIISVIVITYGRLQCSPEHILHCTYILHNNVTKTYQCIAKADSTVTIFLAGKPLDAEKRTTGGSSNIFYHASFTANPDLHKKQILCSERLANGTVINNSIANILVKYEPVIKGNCLYSEENNKYLVDFNVTANPQLTLAEYASTNFTVNDTRYDKEVSSVLTEFTDNSFRLQYQIQNFEDGNIIATSLQASNRIGPSSSCVICPVPQKKEPQEMTTAGGNVPATAKGLKQCDCNSASNRLKPHKFCILVPLLMMIFAFT